MVGSQCILFGELIKLSIDLGVFVLPGFFFSRSFEELQYKWGMAVAAPGQLNLEEPPSWGSRSVDCFEKLEQIGEGTYG